MAAKASGKQRCRCRQDCNLQWGTWRAVVKLHRCPPPSGACLVFWLERGMILGNRPAGITDRTAAKTSAQLPIRARAGAQGPACIAVGVLGAQASLAPARCTASSRSPACCPRSAYRSPRRPDEPGHRCWSRCKPCALWCGAAPNTPLVVLAGRGVAVKPFGRNPLLPLLLSAARRGISEPPKLARGATGSLPRTAAHELRLCTRRAAACCTSPHTAQPAGQNPAHHSWSPPCMLARPRADPGLRCPHSSGLPPPRPPTHPPLLADQRQPLHVFAHLLRVRLVVALPAGVSSGVESDASRQCRVLSNVPVPCT